MPVELNVIMALTLTAAVVLIVRQQNLRRRQMIHRERLASIERGELPTSPGEDDMTAFQSATDTHHNRLLWFRLTTLGLGFLLLFGGMGMVVALIIVEDAELRKLWTLGLIPLMTGFGLIAFWLVSRRLVQ